MQLNLSLYIILSCFICLFCACGDEVENLIETKADTVFVDVSERPSARIISYAVENVSTDIYCAINDETRQITIYLPHYYALALIDPLITLPEGASIEPDDEEVFPVFSDEPFTYTVSAPGEEDVVYSVKVIVQQPVIVLNEFSTGQDTAVYSVNGVLPVSGENFIPAVSTGFLIDQDGKEFQVDDFGLSLSVNSSTVFTVRPVIGNFGEENIDSFLNRPFWFEMRAYALTARMKYPIRFEMP